MRGYYTGKLSGERLRRCYEIAPPRVQRYLESEVRFVLGRLRPGDAVLELGCGYGRVTARLAGPARLAVGIDSAPEGLLLARRLAGTGSRCRYARMDALELAFGDAAFDAVVCVQNGICAFGVDQQALVREALRVTRDGGRVLFSSYSERFWAHRLEWFEAQAAAGLVGAIDYERTGNGTIACRDGFRSGYAAPEAFRALAGALGRPPTISEIDDSSVFCELAVHRRG